jgi:hypothetical protein
MLGLPVLEGGNNRAMVAEGDPLAAAMGALSDLYQAGWVYDH